MRLVAPATFECDELVVGATLPAVEYAVNNNLPLLTNGKVIYFLHEVDEGGKLLQDTVAMHKISLTLRGKLIFPFVDQIFLRQEYLSLISRTSAQKLYFNKIYLFDPEEIENTRKTINYYEVVDIIKKRYLLTPEVKSFVTGEKDFITHIDFGKQNLIYAKSKLSKKQLGSYAHSEFMARRKVGWWLKQNGYKSHVKGNVTKLYHHQRLKRAHYNLKLDAKVVDKRNG
tara:strand:+ start:25 stop:708 length:684 start_codon:yes stop_codon:yes gene_type:complete